jgi:hypothetical protein
MTCHHSLLQAIPYYALADENPMTFVVRMKKVADHDPGSSSFGFNFGISPILRLYMNICLLWSKL